MKFAKFSIYLLVSGILKCILALCLMAGGLAQATENKAATIVFVSGKASIIDVKGVHRPAIRGDEVISGDVLESNDGIVQLRFSDGASMSLQPSTRFRVDAYRFRQQDDKASAEDQGFFSLLKGGFRTVTGLIGKQNKEQYRVDTGVAVIGIRGTDYRAQLDGKGLTLSTFSGLVEVCNNAGCVSVATGQNILVKGIDVMPAFQGNLSAGSKEPSMLPGVPQASPVNQQPTLPTGGAHPNSPTGGQGPTGPNYPTGGQGPTGPNYPTGGQTVPIGPNHPTGG